MIVKILKKEYSEYDRLYKELYTQKELTESDLDKLTESDLDKLNESDMIICNCVPIKWKNFNWILIANFELLRYLESNSDFDATIFFNEKIYKNVSINKNRIIPLYNKNLLEMKEEDQLKYTCYYDVFLNLVLIKCKFELDYLYNFDINVDNDIPIDYSNLKLLWMSDDLNNNELEIINFTSNIKYNWEIKFLSEAPILNLQINFEQYYNIYSGAVLINGKNIVGIVESICENSISLIPYLLINKFLKKILNNTDNHLDIGLNKVLIDKQNNIYGVCAQNDIINKYKTKDKDGKITKVLIEMLEHGTIIKSIDNYPINYKGNLDLSNKKINSNGLEICTDIPIKSYIYFIKNEYIRDSEYILKLEILKDSEDYDFEINDGIVQIIKSESKSESKFDFEEINITVVNRLNALRNILSNILVIKKENIYILELNEFLLNLLKRYLIKTNFDLIKKIEESVYSSTTLLIAIKIYKINCQVGFNKKYIKIGILEKFSNINELIGKFKKKIHLIHYIKKNI